MASIRRVRRDFRKEVLELICRGDGNTENLVEIAGRHFGHDVGYEVLIKTFLHNEVSNAVTCLRTEGLIETIGKKWKPVEQLQSEDIDVISIRRLKRLRGELESGLKLATDYNRAKDAEVVGRMLELVSHQLQNEELVEA